MAMFLHIPASGGAGNARNARVTSEEKDTRDLQRGWSTTWSFHCKKKTMEQRESRGIGVPFTLTRSISIAWANFCRSLDPVVGQLDRICSDNLTGTPYQCLFMFNFTLSWPLHNHGKSPFSMQTSEWQFSIAMLNYQSVISWHDFGWLSLIGWLNFQNGVLHSNDSE